MGLIADIVESVRAAFGGIAGGFRSLAALTDADLENLAFVSQEAVKEAAFAFGIGEGGQLAEWVGEIALTVEETVRDPQAYAVKVLRKWSVAFNKALAVLNVDMPDRLAQLDFGNPEIAASTLRVQGEAAGERVAAALAVINSIVITANAISVLAEATTGGTIRSIAEAVQSWIWANGIGGLASMAYQPQLNASVFPWLNRKFQFDAQASIPGSGDLTRFQLREVFEPERRAELLQGPSRPTYNHYMQEQGFSEYWADSFWAAHWVLPSIGQLNEMLFRGVIDRERWETFVRFNDFDPSSIPNLAAIIYNPFTRVDVRRMADLGVLDRDEQLQAYADLGNFSETRVDAASRIRAVWKANPDFTVDKAQALVVFTRLFNALPDLRARFKNGWINADELLQGLLDTGMPAVRARNQWETIVKVEKEARVAPEKELTRGLVARAWKLRLISFPQGVFLLQRMGWDSAEAELILRVQSLPEDPLAFVQTSLGTRLGSPFQGSGGEVSPELEE